MTCKVCGALAWYRVKSRGYCQRHKAEAKADWAAERANWRHERTHERIPSTWEAPWSDPKHSAHKAKMRASFS